MKKILVVDDELDLLDAIKAGLEGDGYEVIPLPDCRQVFAKAKEIGPALVITDLMMPYVNGYEVILGIRDLPECRETRIILMSSTEPTARQVHFKWDLFLKKPFDLESLQGAVRKLIGKPGE